MGSDKLNGRQLGRTALLAALSPAAALAGEMDWRWVLAAAPLGVVLVWLVVKRLGGRPLFSGTGGRVLSVFYGGWAVVLLGTVLDSAARRICVTNASDRDRIWVLLLIVLPLLWMGWGRSAPFFRAAELFCPVVAVVLVVVVAFAVPHTEWSWLAEGGGEHPLSGTVLVLTVPLFVLPYIYKAEVGRGGLALPVIVSLAAAAAVAVPAAVLSPAVAGELEAPFFVASGAMGESVRGEGLISALWLLSDLTLAGLLSRMWTGKHWAAAAAAAGGLLAATGVSNIFPPPVLAVGTAALLVLTLLIPRGKDGFVVTVW